MDKNHNRENTGFLKLQKEKIFSRSFSTIFTLDLGLKNSSVVVVIVDINTLSIYYVFSKIDIYKIISDF